MKTINKRSIPLQLGILLIVCWCAVILAFGHFTSLGLCGWISFLFVPLSLAAIYYCTANIRTPKNDSSTVGIPIYYSYIFLTLSIIINAVYIFINNRVLTPFFIVADVLLLAAYLGIMLLSSAYHRSLPAKIRKVQNNTAFSSTASRSVGALLADAKDPEIHQALVHLKETIDYSSNSTQNVIDEKDIMNKIDELRSVLMGSDKTAVITAISDVERLWRTRNTKF